MLLSLIATLFGIFGSICYIGVALTPSNLNLDWHIFFAHWIFRSLFAASIIYSVLIFKTEGFDNKYAYGFIVFGIMVSVYVLLSQHIFKDPTVYKEYLRPHVISQKMVSFWILFAFYIYSIGLGKYLYKKVT